MLLCLLGLWSKTLISSYNMDIDFGVVKYSLLLYNSLNVLAVLTHHSLRVQKIKNPPISFKLTFTGLICKENSRFFYSHYCEL